MFSEDARSVQAWRLVKGFYTGFLELSRVQEVPDAYSGGQHRSYKSRCLVHL